MNPSIQHIISAIGQEKMESLSAVFLVVLVLSCGLIAETKKKVADLQSCDYPALYNFGDSNSDTGGMAAAFFPMIAPCGETYFHRPAGRGSDGRLIIDFVGNNSETPNLITTHLIFVLLMGALVLYLL